MPKKRPYGFSPANHDRGRPEQAAIKAVLVPRTLIGVPCRPEELEKRRASRHAAARAPEQRRPLHPASQPPPFNPDTITADEPSSATIADMVAQPDGRVDRAEQPTGWKNVEIWFLSETSVQIFVNGKPREPQNYADLGFVDRRDNKKPRLAWQALRLLAVRKGTYSPPSPENLKKIEKAIQDARAILRKHFGLAGDPLPFVKSKRDKVHEYRAAFIIGTRPSYHS